MNIQANSGVSTYYAFSKIAPLGSVAKIMGTEPARNTAAVLPSFLVTLSSIGKALAAEESILTRVRTNAQEELISEVSADRAEAARVARDIAYMLSAIAWDTSNIADTGFTTKLLATGMIVDDEFINDFNAEAPEIDTRRRAAYETQRTAGTDPLLTLARMIDFINAQSQGYLDATGWRAGVSHFWGGSLRSTH